MEFSVKRGLAHQQKTPCIIVAVHAGKTLGDIGSALDKRSRGAINRVVSRGDITGKVGETLLLPDLSGVEPERVLLVGAGNVKGVTATSYRKIVNAAANALIRYKLESALSTLLDIKVQNGDQLSWKTDAHVCSIAAAAYRFNEHKSKPVRSNLTRFSLLASDEEFAGVRDAVARARALASGIEMSRDLGNRPGNVCTPSHLAESAVALAEMHPALSVTVLEEEDMERLAMGSLLSVSRGSREPAKLITLEYRGSDESKPPIVLVGKGVTFDSGGISLKGGAGMDEMKYDMCGAASVLGTLSAIAEIGPPINVVGVIPATENLPDGDASKPGDIVTSMSGQTIEILNTDAEGRLILCDALTYSARFEPEVVIDIATLTGACVVALGAQASGLMSNNDALAEDLLAAGERTNDRAWRLPLWQEYQRQLDSNFADMANVGGRAAGTITAGCFLSRFTKKYRWAHIDVAGTAWTSGKNKSATGRPVALLVDYILSRVSA
jgi:leucyl aminopeptidase